MEDLIINNTNLIYIVLQKMGLYEKSYYYYDIGLMGLIRAAKRFDPSKGCKFTTLAYRCIQNAVLIDIRDSQASTRRANVDAVSLDEPVLFDEDGETKSLLDTISSGFDMEEYMIEKEKIELVNNAISTLSPEERDLIRKFYGFERKNDSMRDS